MGDHLLSPVQTCARLGIGRSKLYELMACGKIESVRIGSLRRIPSSCVDEYVAKLRCHQPERESLGNTADSMPPLHPAASGAA